MKFSFRGVLLLTLTIGGALACSDSPTTAQLTPYQADRSLARIKATDSLMLVTEVTYSDTSLLLKRITPLAADVSASATIGSAGGEIKLPGAGAKIEIPAGALSAPTLITMTALAGPDVAYEFQPHGLTFARPVKISQELKPTWAYVFPILMTGMHGSYYDQSLEASFIDPLKFLARVKENQIGYLEQSKSHIRFYIDHFSGYMVSCGRGGDNGR